MHRILSTPTYTVVYYLSPSVSAMMLTSGKMMPDFDLPNQFGEPISLRGFRGRWLVLWWYPEAASEGCTIEGRGFHQLERDFSDLGAAIVGLSFNTVAENQN